MSLNTRDIGTSAKPKVKLEKRYYRVWAEGLEGGWLPSDEMLTVRAINVPQAKARLFDALRDFYGSRVQWTHLRARLRNAYEVVIYERAEGANADAWAERGLSLWKKGGA